MSWWSVFFAIAHAECPDRAMLLDTLDQQLVRNDIKAAEEASAALIAAFGCGSIADPIQVAHLWLAEAVILSATGENEAASSALAAAYRLSPSTRPDAYGPIFVARWEEASTQPVPSSGRVLIEPFPGGYLGAIDGTMLPFPAELPAGLHLVQVGTTIQTMVAAKRIDLPKGLDASLAFELPELQRQPMPVEPEPLALLPAPVPSDSRPSGTQRDLRGRRVVQALIVGGVGAFAYSATFVTAPAFYRPRPADRSSAMGIANNVLVTSSVGLGLLSGVLLVSVPTLPRAAPTDTSTP